MISAVFLKIIRMMIIIMAVVVVGPLSNDHDDQDEDFEDDN